MFVFALHRNNTNWFAYAEPSLYFKNKFHWDRASLFAQANLDLFFNASLSSWNYRGAPPQKFFPLWWGPLGFFAQIGLEPQFSRSHPWMTSTYHWCLATSSFFIWAFFTMNFCLGLICWTLQCFLCCVLLSKMR
jgi:hypothetical protein